MRTPNRVDTSTLGWVKDEIDQTLGHAREALERYVADGEDITPLRLFANNVHQVAGTLQMVELDGAAQLAQETESLASAVVSGKVDGAGGGPVGELLGKGLSHLSRYMERLARGLPDRPLDNVDVINELRGARNAEALDRYSLFYPDLEVYPSRDKAVEELEGEEYAQRVHELRRRYQTSLLKWLRSQEDEDAWRELAGVTDGLFDLSRFRVSTQIWWVARAYLDVLKSEELARDDPRKHILAKLDQLMRKLVEESEAAIAREGSDQLVRSMLYHVGLSDVGTDNARAVRRLFDLDTLLGAEPEASAPPAGDALAPVRERALESLRAVHAALDEYARPGGAGDAFDAADQQLSEVADAIRDAGVEELANLCDGVRRVFGGGETEQSEDALIAAARAMLFVEQALEHPEDLGGDWRQEAAAELDRLRDHAASTEMPSLAIESREIDAETLDAQELRRLVIAVGGQMEESLTQAEQSLERFSKDASDTDSLAAVIESMQQVHGAVRMLGQHKLSDLLELAIGQLEAMAAGDAYPDDPLMDALAVTIGTTDAYVKGMERNASNIDAMLGRAMQELESAVSEDRLVTADPAATLTSIRQSFDAWMRDNADYGAFRTLRQNLRDIGALAHQQNRLSLRSIAQEMTNLLDIVTDDPSFLSGEVEQTLRRSLSILSESSASLEGVPEAAPAAGDAEQPGREDVVEEEGDDDVVREVFAEEAQECLRDIGSNLDLLKDPEDREALANVRRSFHTIKGSGRMAKARDIAELAWVVEDVLNRCLDGALPVSGAVVGFVSEARTELSGLLERGLDSSADLRAWREKSASLLQDAALPAAGPAAASPGSGTQAVAAADSTPALEDGAAGESAGAVDGPDASPAAPEPGGPEAGTEPMLQKMEDLGDEGHMLTAETGDHEGGSPFSDDEVITIFSKETLSHLAVIRGAVEECRLQGRAAVSDELLRAVHTLQGNARSLHLVEMSEAYTSLDDALRARTASGAGLQKSEADVLDALLVATAKVLDHLNRDRRFPDVVRQELAELAGRIEHTWSGAGDDEPRRDGLGGLGLVSDFVAGNVEDEEHGEEERPDPSVFDDLVESGRPAGPGTRDDDGADAVPGDLETTAGGAAPEEAPDTGETAAGEGDFDVDLKDVFMEEASDILSRFESSLQQGRQSGLDPQLANTLKRELHTLKGSSRAAGLEVIGDLSHDAESMLEGVAGESEPPGELLETLEEVHDTLANLVQELDAGRIAEPDSRLVRRLREGTAAKAPEAPAPGERQSPNIALVLEDGTRRAHGDEAPREAGEPGDDREEREPHAPGPDRIAAESRTTADAGRPGGRATVRIQSNVLDRLVDYAGEVSISRAQLEEQLSGLKGNLNELRANVARFSDQVRELDIQADTQIRSRVAEEKISEPGHDFDPLEMDRYSRLQQLSRSLSESVDDLVTIQTGLNRFATQTEGVLSQQAMLNSELQDGLMSARMVPFNTLVPRLRHQVRRTARELEKEADFTVTGGELEVDRNMLGQLSEALEHMIRNSLDHGIEAAQARTAAGKSARGSLRIDCRQEGSEVLLRFSDDGAGLDVERIKGRAVEAGLLSADTDLTDDEVIQLIVLSGFSTTRSVTRLSGRGVGLDVVNDAVRRLGGSLSMDNRPGAGVSFDLRLPLSLSITQAMFVRCGDQQFAIPLGVIETVLKTEPENLQELSKDGDPLFRRGDRVYTLMDLTATLGLESASVAKRVPVLVVRMGAREVAVRVDEFVSTDEIVVKQLGDHLGRLSGINGATITGDGSVVIILDLADLWLAQERLPAFRQEAPQSADAAPRVMVVDDSLTVRKVTGRNLGRHGMEVTMARDGFDALEQLAKGKPDVMLVDIEMPRMDGYELTTKIREDVNYRDIPVIIITSRAGAKHRERAMELGANAYLTKPYQERDLLKEVNALLPPGRAADGPLVDAR